MKLFFYQVECKILSEKGFKLSEAIRYIELKFNKNSNKKHKKYL